MSHKNEKSAAFTQKSVELVTKAVINFTQPSCSAPMLSAVKTAETQLQLQDKAMHSSASARTGTSPAPNSSVTFSTFSGITSQVNSQEGIFHTRLCKCKRMKYPK